MMRSTILLACLAVSAGVARADTATPTTADGQARFETGSAAYAAGDFARASEEFSAGYGVEPWSGFLFAWAQAERRAGDCTEAIELYRRFLATKPSVKAEQLAADGIGACNGSLGTPPPMVITLPAPPPVAPPRPLPPRPFRHKLAVTLGALGVAGAGTGVTFYLLARRDGDAALRAASYPEAERLHDRAGTRTTIARIAGGVGGALCVAAAIRFALAGPAPRDRGVDVAITPSGELVVAGTF